MRIPRETWAMQQTLPRSSRDARQALIEANLPRDARVEMHRERRAYGMRNGRAICPTCYVENGPSKYDPTSGRCVDGCEPVEEGDDEMTTRTRGQRGPNVPLATREDILATMDTEGAIEQARRLGLETDTVRKIRARDGDPTTRSLRQLIVRLLDDHPYADSEALLRDIRHHDPVGQWRGVDLHSLQHQLGSMQRLALIRAARRRNGAFSVLTDIRLRNHARVVAHDAQATTQDVDPPTNVSDVTLEDATPTVDLPTSWPILEALRAAVDAQVDVREKVAALMSAAEALDAVDPDAAELLVDRAASLAPDDLSPVEFEYLQFATTHGGDA